MTLDEIYEVDLSKCDFSHMNDERIKRHLVSLFLRDLDKDCVKIEVLGERKSIFMAWVDAQFHKEVESYKLEFGRELTRVEKDIIYLSIINNRFDHDEELRNIQKIKNKK